MAPIEQLEQMCSSIRQQQYLQGKYHKLPSRWHKSEEPFVAYQGESARDRDCPNHTGALPQSVPNHLEWSLRTAKKRRDGLPMQLTRAEENLG